MGLGLVLGAPEAGSSADFPSLSPLTPEGRALVHLGSSLARAEEESVLVPVGEHCEAATAGGPVP